MNKWYFVGSCIDTDKSRTDIYGDHCSWYENSESQCGNYDDNDFVASELCCTCGGGAEGG